MNLQDNHDDKRGSSRLNDLGYLEMLLHPLAKYKGGCLQNDFTNRLSYLVGQ